MSSINYTIIIPHYNIPKLLGRCIRSIPHRADVQVIVVDDCSPDAENYRESIPELSRPDVEFYSTPYGGSAGRARNIGIEHAVGKWLTFLDADDLLVDNISEVFDRYKDNSSDVVYLQSSSVMSDNLDQQSDRNMFCYNFEAYFRTGNEQVMRLEFDALWGKLIKKDLVVRHNILFDEIKYSNDTFFSAAIGVYAKNIFVAPETAYIVTERHHSLTSGKMKTLDEWYVRYHSALHVQSFFDEHNIKFRRYAFADFLLLMWGRNQKRFLKEWLKLSIRNKMRYIYYLTRHMAAKTR